MHQEFIACFFSLVFTTQIKLIIEIITSIISIEHVVIVKYHVFKYRIIPGCAEIYVYSLTTELRKLLHDLHSGGKAVEQLKGPR